MVSHVLDGDHLHFILIFAVLENWLIQLHTLFVVFLWSPYVIGQTIYIFMLWFVLLLSFFLA